MVSPIPSSLPLARKDHEATLRPSGGFMDPGFAREPGVIGVADRTTGTREKNRAGAKALTIDLDAGGDRASALRALDHDHTHTNLPRFSWCFFQREPAGWICLFGASY